MKSNRSISYFLSLDDVIQRANDVPYGLCASVWTENSGRIHRVASKLKVHYHYIFDLFLSKLITTSYQANLICNIQILIEFRLELFGKIVG